jgi:hypothetical protein
MYLIQFCVPLHPQFFVIHVFGASLVVYEKISPPPPPLAPPSPLAPPFLSAHIPIPLVASHKSIGFCQLVFNVAFVVVVVVVFDIIF